MSADRINLRHLRAFQAVHDHGSITAAADVAHLSQPAITQAIAKLERVVGVTLFDRGRSGMVPTVGGAVFARRTHRALSLLRSGCLAAAQKDRSGKDARFDLAITSTQLRALIAVVAHGNFSVAARAVGVAQPTLYRVARDLEQVSGLRLYEKSMAGITVTPAARALNRASKLAFAELNQGLEEAAQSVGSGTATIVIGSLPLARTNLLPAAITQLTGIQPDVAIKVVDGPYADLLQALREGEIDLMIGALRDPLPADDVVQEHLFQDYLGVYCGPHHPLARRPGVSVRDLAEYPWVVPRPGTPTRSFFDEFIDQARLGTHSALIETSSMVLIRGVLNGSDRLTMISHQQMREDVRLGILCPLPVALNDTGRPIGLTLRKTWSPTETQSRFLDLLRKAATDQAGPIRSLAERRAEPGLPRSTQTGP